MNLLKAEIHRTIAALDEIWTSLIDHPVKILQTVAAACQIFKVFLTIHPYANGNGHAGRLILWSLLGRYNLWPVNWAVDPRPPEPTYTNAIKAHRDGDPRALIQFVLNNLH